MEPTTEQIQKLAKVFQLGQTGYEDEWEDLYLDENNVVVTRDTIDDFLNASVKDWTESSEVQKINDSIYWDRIQVSDGQERIALAVIDCGDFRVSYSQ